jgi:hypothetical protein
VRAVLILSGFREALATMTGRAVQGKVVLLME